MTLPRLGGKLLLVMALGMNLALAVAGCGGNANEREFLDSAPPGEPSPFPNESVAQRKARTRSEPYSVRKKGQSPGQKAAVKDAANSSKP